jgi:hypothetical protein
MPITCDKDCRSVIITAVLVILTCKSVKFQLNKALEMGVCFHEGPAFGVHEGTYGLRENGEICFCIRRNLIEEFEGNLKGNEQLSAWGPLLGNVKEGCGKEQLSTWGPLLGNVKEGCGKEQLSTWGPLLGNLHGVRLPGPLKDSLRALETKLLLLLTYLLTSYNTALLEKLTGLQLVKKFPAIY